MAARTVGFIRGSTLQVGSRPEVSFGTDEHLSMMRMREAIALKDTAFGAEKSGRLTSNWSSDITAQKNGQFGGKERHPHGCANDRNGSRRRRGVG